MIPLQQAQTFNVPSFILHNKVRNENDVLLSFKYHKFLIKPYTDRSPKIVARKAGQVGFSTLAIIRALHLARFDHANVIYTLPSRSAVKDFVIPKVDPLINNNPEMASWINSTNSIALKKVGDRFVYFRGSWEDSTAISLSAHVLINDEVDRSNQKVLRTYITRLDAAKLDRPDLGWVWKFSNPSIPGNGVDEWWEESDKKHWVIKCSRCNHRQFLDFPDNVDLKNECYICSKCKQPLSEEDRLTTGAWVSQRFGRDVSGYWYTQMMAPWVTAKKIIEDSRGDQAVFHNFTLGKPYISKDDQVSRESIVRCCVPDANPMTDVGMGVDVKAKVKNYVLMNRQGIFRVGETESWDEIKRIRNQYNAYCVIDGNPYPTFPIKMTEEYPGKVFVHYYKENTTNQTIIEWGSKDKGNTVYSDRTKGIDSMVADINAQDVYFNMTHQELEDKGYIQHWLNIYRTVEEDTKGIKRAVWRHLEWKDDDYVHATWYAFIACTLTKNVGYVTSYGPSQTEPIASPSRGNMVDLKQLLEASKKSQGKDWKSI